MNNMLRTCFVAGILSLCWLACLHALAADPPVIPDLSQGMNVLIIGHSLTVNLDTMPQFTPLIGHPKHRQMHYLRYGVGIEADYEYNPDDWHAKYFAPGRSGTRSS